MATGPAAQAAPQEPAVGDVVAAGTYHLTRDQLIRYAGASGDFNPLHWSPRIAAAMGLPGVIGHGMLTMALAGRLLTDWLGDPTSVLEYSVRFSSPVVVPDGDTGITIQMTATVSDISDDGLVAVTIAARTDDNRVLTRARAVVRRP